MPRALPFSPPLGRPRLPWGEPHFPCFPSSGSRPSRPQLWRSSPPLHPFFSVFYLSRVRAFLGHRHGLCHTLSSLVALSCGNTATVPPRSPPTTTLHVSRLTEASTVRPFYLGSSTLSCWCLSRLSPTLYRSEMAGISRDSPTVPPWPTATSPRCSNSRTTYLYRRGRTQGARWCPWIHRRSSPPASIRRRVCSLFFVTMPRGSRCQWPSFRPPLLFKSQIFVPTCKNHISYSWAPKFVKQNLWHSLRWLVFNKNIICGMFSVKNNCYELILLFQSISCYTAPIAVKF